MIGCFLYSFFIIESCSSWVIYLITIDCLSIFIYSLHGRCKSKIQVIVLRERCVFTVSPFLSLPCTTRQIKTWAKKSHKLNSKTQCKRAWLPPRDQNKFPFGKPGRTRAKRIGKTKWSSWLHWLKKNNIWSKCFYPWQTEKKVNDLTIVYCKAQLLIWYNDYGFSPL